MLQAYKKVQEMEAVALLKLEQDKKTLDKVNSLLYLEKKYIIEKLILYLKKELNIEYFVYKVFDIDGNFADMIVSKGSKLFRNIIEGKNQLNFNVEEFINKKFFENRDEIILIDLGFDDKILNLKYLCDTLCYDNLSYSEKIIEKLSMFLNYIINRNIEKNKLNKKK